MWQWIDPLGLCKKSKGDTGPGWYCDVPPVPKKGSFPDEIFSKKAPGSKGSNLPQVAPGTKKLEGQYINDQGRVEPWEAHYDDYGRQVGRTDFNAGNKAARIPDTHHHTREYNKLYPDGHSTGDHIEGVYKP